MCGCTYNSRGSKVLSENNALSLDDEEVDEFVNIANHGLKSLAGDSVVSAGSNLRRKAIVEHKLARAFRCNRDAQNHPAELESPSDHVKITSGKDDGDNAGVADGGSTCHMAC